MTDNHPMTDNHRLVRYTTTGGTVAANTEAIDAVFADLTRLQPPGLSYRVYRRGTEFFHVVRSDGDPLAAVPAFQQFLAGIGDRAVTGPTAESVELIGAYEAPPPSGEA